MLDPTPIYLQLDKPREVAYTVGSAIALKANGFGGQAIMRRLEDSAEGAPQYAVYHAAVVAWLVACLQREARRAGDVLDAAWVENQLDSEEKLVAACGVINQALIRYYGEDPR